MAQPSPCTTRQYYGHFKYKGLVEHVIVETFGRVITRIFVITHTTVEVPHLQDGSPVDYRSHRLESWFTLESVDPGGGRSRGYDASNKLHFKALFLVFDILTNQSEDEVQAKKWQARMKQDWPLEERLSDEGPY